MQACIKHKLVHGSCEDAWNFLKAELIKSNHLPCGTWSTYLMRFIDHICYLILVDFFIEKVLDVRANLGEL
jgi:hypothetical protein